MIVDLCIMCDLPLSPERQTEEHIIPNALGGLLTTRSATCISCNSGAGHSDDAYIANLFGPLLASLDVVRSRKRKGRPSSFEDPDSGYTFEIPAGQKPKKAANFRREKTAEGEFFYVTAPTEDEARLLVRNYTKRHDADLVIKPISNSANAYKWRIPTEAHDLTLLRVATRIAAYFARHEGVDIRPSSPAVEFLRGVRGPLGIVSPARGDVVEITPQPARPLTHGVFLSRSPENGECYAYVVLFEYLEFVVSFGPIDAEVSTAGHIVNLVAGKESTPEFVWIASYVQMRKWLRTPRINFDRSISRFQSLKYYIENQDSIWIERASLRALDTYLEAIERGKSEVEARSLADSRAREILSNYGIELENLSFYENEVRS